MSAPELTINVTEFKAKCLGLIDDLEAGRLDKVNVTRRGRLHAVMTRHPDAEPYAFDLDRFQSELGRHRLQPTPDYDPSEPLLDSESMAEWEASIDAIAGTPALKAAE